MDENENYNNFNLNELKCLIFGKHDIKLENTIATGGFAKIKKAILSECYTVAVKILKFPDIAQFKRELQYVKIFKHANTPQFFGIYIDQDKLRIGLVFEYIEGEVLDKILHKHCLGIQLIHLGNFAQVMDYLHSMKLIHRDLKTNNIMIDTRQHFKLLDLGISKMSNRSKTTTAMKGTMIYMAPENFHVPTDLSISQGRVSITNKVDVWGFGLVASEVLSGDKPWINHAQTENQLLSLFLSQHPFPIPETIAKKTEGEKLHKLILMCTDKIPSNRPNFRFIKYFIMRILYEYIAKKGIGDVISSEENIQNRVFLLQKIEEYLQEYHFMLLHSYDEDFKKVCEYFTHDKILKIKNSQNGNTVSKPVRIRPKTALIKSNKEQKICRKYFETFKSGTTPSLNNAKKGN